MVVDGVARFNWKADILIRIPVRRNFLILFKNRDLRPKRALREPLSRAPGRDNETGWEGQCDNG